MVSPGMPSFSIFVPGTRLPQQPCKNAHFVPGKSASKRSTVAPGQSELTSVPLFVPTKVAWAVKFTNITSSAPSRLKSMTCSIGSVSAKCSTQQYFVLSAYSRTVKSEKSRSSFV